MSIENRPRKHRTTPTWGMVLLTLVAALLVIGFTLTKVLQGSGALGAALVLVLSAYVVNACLERLWPTEGAKMGIIKACIVFTIAALVVFTAAWLATVS